MSKNPQSTTEQTLKLEARLSAIEHVLSKLLGTVLIASGKTQQDVDTMISGTVSSIQKTGFRGLDPAISDAMGAELEEAVTDLYNLVKLQM